MPKHRPTLFAQLLRIRSGILAKALVGDHAMAARWDMTKSILPFVLFLFAAPASAQETVLMRRDYQSHVDAGYPVVWPKSGAPQTMPREHRGRRTEWDYVHRSSGCWNDLACVEAIWPAGQAQKEAGWFWSMTGAGPIDLSKPIYIRYRVRYLTSNSGARNNKALIWCLGGDCGGVPRLMMHHSIGNATRVGCVDPRGASTHVVVTVAQNIGPDRGDEGMNCAGKALAINKWWNIQCSILFGRRPVAKCWFNNNNFYKPDDVSSGWTGPWIPTNPNEMIRDIGFLTDAPAAEVRWQQSHLEIAEEFDANWCQNVSGVTCASPGQTRSNRAP
jgi:hypothetical protein